MRTGLALLIICVGIYWCVVSYDGKLAGIILLFLWAHNIEKHTRGDK